MYTLLFQRPIIQFRSEKKAQTDFRLLPCCQNKDLHVPKPLPQDAPSALLVKPAEAFQESLQSLQKQLTKICPQKVDLTYLASGKKLGKWVDGDGSPEPPKFSK